MKPVSTATAFGVASLGIAAFSAMDALMKGLSVEMGAYNALLWRTLAGAVIGGAMFFARRSPWPGPQAARIHVLRGVLSAAMAILMRRQALLAKPLEVAFFMSFIMSACFLIAAPLLAVAPTAPQVPALAGAALLAFVSLMLLSWAYARAEAQHLAPVEYTAFIWASFFGLVVFSEPVLPLTLIGAAMIVVACVIATRRRPVSMAEREAAL